MNKKIIFFVILFFGFLVAFQKVDASILIDLNNDPGPGHYNNYIYLATSTPNIMTSFKPRYDNLYKIQTMVSGTTFPFVSEIYVCKGLLGSSSGPHCENATFVASTTSSQSYFENFSDALMPANTKVAINGDYYFSQVAITHPEQAHTVIMYNGTGPNYYSYQRSSTSTGEYSYSNNSAVFKTYYSDVYFNNLYFVVPDSSVTSYKDFQSWKITANAQPNTQQNYCYYNIEVCVGTTTSYSLGCDNQLIQNGDNQLVNIVKTPILKNGVYLARARMYDYCEATTTTLLASSTTSFIIDNTYGTDANIQSETDLLSHACDQIASSTGGFDDFRYGFECGARKAGIWAFYPSNESTDYLKTSFGIMKEKFPFSAYFGIIDTISGSIASSSTSTDGSLKMPMVDKTGHYYMLSVLSSTSMPNLIGVTNYTLFRNSLGWCIWMLVAFLIYIQFKKI